MKKVLLVLAALIAMASANAQTLWSEDFSNGIPSNWTMFNDNNTAHNSNFTAAWAVSSNYGNPAPGACSASWFDPSGQADRWLITDAFVVPSTGYCFYIEAACYEAAYPDGFCVKVSNTTNASRADFTTTIINVSACTDQFQEYTASLDAFVGDTIYIAVVQNSNDMNFLITDNWKVYTPAENEIMATGMTLPNFGSINADINLQGTIKNKGSQPITSFTATYKVNGGADVTANITDVNVASGATYTFTHPTAINVAAAGAYTIDLTVSNPNGVADPTPEDNTVSGTLSVYDMAAAVSRRTILEEFTGANCGYCPAGAQRIEQAIEGTDVIYVLHHAGFGTDALTCSANTAYTFFYNAGGSTYAPALMVDRFHGDASEPGPVIGVGQVTAISSYLNTCNQIPCFLTLDMSGLNYDASTRAFSGAVTGHFTSPIYTANTRLTLMIVEDSNVMSQADYYNGTQANYIHNRAVRGTLTDTWGAAITPDANGDFTYNVTATLPSNLNDWRTRIVAIVSNYDANDANNCSVMQAATTANLPGNYVGINEANEVALNVYPNPATDYVTVEANGIQEVVVYNALGQKVYTNSNVNADTYVLNTTDFAAGVYMVTLRTANGIASKRVNIVR